MLNENQKLIALAKLISPFATLYAVGGCVRDELLGCECYDIDICSKLRVEDVKNILLNSDYAVSDKNLRMGTVIISNGDFKAEYTSFRKDSYDGASGKHSPLDVEFTDDISEDALRRDFKCNAIYRDILSGENVDPLCGMCDVKDRILSTADASEKVFEADGLRILRLVRFYAELGFEIEEQTLRVARKNAWRVKDIAVERIRDELCKIFVADTAHPTLYLKDAHVRGLKLLDKLGLVNLLLPELAGLKGLEQNKKYHIYDAYNHSLKAFELSPPHLRWVALLHDVGKRSAYLINNCASMRGHDSIGADMVDSLMRRLKFPTAERERAIKLIAGHMIDVKGDASPFKLRRFAVENSAIIDDLCTLKDVDAEASCGHKPDKNRLREAWEEVVRDGTPLSVSDLKIDGNDIIALGATGEDVGRILGELFSDTVLNPSLNNRQSALEYAKRKCEKLAKNK